MALTPIYLSLIELVAPVGACIVLAMLYSAGAKLAGHQAFWSTFLQHALLGIPVGVIGYIAGDSTGISRAPAVGNVVPAVLTLIGGVSVYAFGTESKNRAVVGYCVAVLAVLFFLGLQTGAFYRETQREEYLESLSRAELRVRTLRSNLGLKEDIPNWMLQGEKQ